jgi:transcriptional regulator with XRE-family HTH domain
MDLGLRIVDVATALGVSQWTVILWEKRRTAPSAHQIPGLIRFLGYDPFPNGRTLGERVRLTRLRLGVSQAALATRIGLDEGTIGGAERGLRLAGRVRRALESFVEGERNGEAK